MQYRVLYDIDHTIESLSLVDRVSLFQRLFHVFAEVIHMRVRQPEHALQFVQHIGDVVHAEYLIHRRGSTHFSLFFHTHPDRTDPPTPFHSLSAFNARSFEIICSRNWIFLCVCVCVRGQCTLATTPTRKFRKRKPKRLSNLQNVKCLADQ